MYQQQKRYEQWIGSLTSNLAWRRNQKREWTGVARAAASCNVFAIATFSSYCQYCYYYYGCNGALFGDRYVSE